MRNLSKSLFGVMMNQNNLFNTRILIGGILIILGVVFLLDNLNIVEFHFPPYLFSFPTFLLLIGIIIVMNSNKKGFGIFLIVLSSFWLLSKAIPGVNFGDFLIPLIFLSLGLYLILKKRKEHSHRYAKTDYFINNRTINTDLIDEIAVFGGGEKVIISENFKGGSITAIFGGMTLDFSSAKLSEGENVLDFLAIFGGAEIIIPNDWNVISDVLPIFGGVSNKRKKNPDMYINTDKTLIIKGLVMFGGCEIKYSK